MASIEGITISNYGVLRNVKLGNILGKPEDSALTPLTAVIGKNGVGKSSLFDAFGFLSDCLKLGVEEACDQRGRGGFDRIRSQGSDDPIVFMVSYRETRCAQLITYVLGIAKDESDRPVVLGEMLFQAPIEPNDSASGAFLVLLNGEGVVWRGYAPGRQIDERVDVELDPQSAQRFLQDLLRMGAMENTESGEPATIDPANADVEFIRLQDKRRLGIATLGGLQQHPRIAAFRQFIEGWYLSYFTPDAARSLPLAGPQRRLNSHGDNLGNVVQYMEREHPDRLRNILTKIADRIPGIDRIDTQHSPDGRLLLRFNDLGFQDPFYAQQMSDGTLKLFSYLLLLEDPEPPPFICIEEPENGLYHKLLEVLAAEFRDHATGDKNAPQIFVTTHQPYLVDALSPEETWVLEKGEDGFSTIRRANDDPIVKAMVDEGLPLGSLWYSDFLDQR